MDHSVRAHLDRDLDLDLHSSAAHAPRHELHSRKEKSMADPVTVSKSAFYSVKPSTPVQLSITIGDGQVGGTDVRIGGAQIGSGDITNLPIGAAAQDLKTKSIDCITTVQRQNAATGHTSVTYSLRGGMQDRDFTYEAIVNQIGDRAVYEISFVFA